MPKILFIASHRPNRSPAQRFRFEQYLGFLKNNGYDYHFSWLISESDDRVFYSPGNIFKKTYIFLKSVVKRFNDVFDANDYDIVFIQREAFMTGSVFFEKLFARKNVKLVFDFDDAIWNHDVSDANKKFGWLKDASKTEHIIALSDLVIAGNKYLADYALQWNINVSIIPTTIDTDEYQPPSHVHPDNRVCIGWSGSITTIRYLEYAVPFFIELKKKFGDKIYFKVIGDGNYKNEQLGIQGVPWTKADELKELAEIDIGIMPMPDDEWSKGKCGLKGLQYMALEIATVMSPVGVNSKIIKDGVNGFLASTPDEWVKKISILIEDNEQRHKMAKEGRRTVVNEYSVNAMKHNYLNLLNKLIDKK
jgi:glycosyltransferase involved in cell wall biosynthesis